MGDGLFSWIAAVLDLVLKFLAEGFDVGGGGWGQVGFFDGLGQLNVSGLQGAGLVAEIADAGAEHVLGDGAGLEGVHVAVDCGLGLLQLGFGSGQFVVVELGGVGGGAGSGGDGSGEQVGVGVDGEEGGEDGLFEDVGADAFAGAGVFAISLAGPAGVVAVAVTFATRRSADVVAMAASASDEPGEEVVGVLVGEAAVVALAALGQKSLGLVEQGGVYEGVVGSVDHVAERHFAEVAAVAQDAEDDLGREAPPGAGAVPVVATLSWVHWFNEVRLHGYCNHVPPAEFEATFYAAKQTDQSMVGIQ